VRDGRLEQRFPVSGEGDAMSEEEKAAGKFERSLSLLCWGYNEEDSIEEFFTRATALLEESAVDCEIVFIEDGSTDRTLEVAKAFQQKNPILRIYPNEKNMNVGICHRRAIQRATKEYLFWQTIDWCYDISRLKEFLQYLNEYDIVQGVRRAPVRTENLLLRPVLTIMQLLDIGHLKKRSDNVKKGLVSIINYILVRILYGVPLSDFQNVTIYPTKWIQSITFEGKSSFANPEGLIKSYWNGMSIKEVPVPFIPRSVGDAKGTRIAAIIASVKDVFGLCVKWHLQGRKVFKKRGRVARLNPDEWKAHTAGEGTTSAEIHSAAQ